MRHGPSPSGAGPRIGATGAGPTSQLPASEGLKNARTLPAAADEALRAPM